MSDNSDKEAAPETTPLGQAASEVEQQIKDLLGQQLRLSQEAVSLAGNKAQAKRLEVVQATSTR